MMRREKGGIFVIQQKKSFNINSISSVEIIERNGDGEKFSRERESTRRKVDGKREKQKRERKKKEREGKLL